MAPSETNFIKFRIETIDNKTIIASVLGENQTLDNLSLFRHRKAPYDGQGALYYVVIVLCIYAFSIILMIGSVIKKSKHDNAVTKYMKGMDRIRRLERREQKFKIRVAVLGRTNSQRSASLTSKLITNEQRDEIPQNLSKQPIKSAKDFSAPAMTHCSSESSLNQVATLEDECATRTDTLRISETDRIYSSCSRMDTLQEEDEDVISV